MKNLEKYLINFDELKEGDTVWHFRVGEIKVITISIGNKYPIQCTSFSFSEKGFFLKSDKYPSIYKSNPFEELKEEPRMIEVRVGSEWLKRELIAIDKTTAVYWTFDKSMPKSISSEYWREIQPKELTEKEEIEVLKKRIKDLELLVKK